MTQPDALKRLDLALDALEGTLHESTKTSGEDASAAALKEELRFLVEERDQLLADLEAERSRVRQLKAANDEVSGRLKAVSGTLKTMLPAATG